MIEIERLREDFRQGRISVEQLIDVFVTLQQQLQAAKRERARLEKLVAQAKCRDLRR